MSERSTTDVETLEALEEEIAVLAAHLHAGEHRLLELVGEFDRLNGWELAGHRTCAHWLAFRTGLDLGACRERVRAARALSDLPKTSASMRRGELSFSQVRALTRVATAENESDLLELARGATAAELERMVRAWKLGSRESETERERERHEGRRLSAFPDLDGLYVVEGRLTPEQGALLMRAVEAASDALYRGRDVSAEASAGDPGSAEEAARRRADALALLAERALAAGFADGPVSGTRAERYQVVLHVDHETLREGGTGLGRSELEDGTRVSAETSRRLSCDGSVVEVAHDSKGGVLNVGRRRRTIPPALRRALEARDRGCRFPGCGLRFTDAHHVKHWADGGETKLENLVLLCTKHHRLLHEQRWSVERWGEYLAFTDPRGQVHASARPNPPKLEADPVAALVRKNERRGVRPGFYTAAARWKRARDIPDDVWLRTREALG